MGKVNQMDIHPNLIDVYTSVDNDNSIHVFQPNRNFKWYKLQSHIFLFIRNDLHLYNNNFLYIRSMP